MGRWAGSIIRIKVLLIAVLSIYQTVDNTYYGPTSIFSQQAAILLKEGRQIPPRKAFLQDLITVVKLLQARQIAVVLAGDFNTDASSECVLQTLKPFVIWK